MPHPTRDHLVGRAPLGEALWRRSVPEVRAVVAACAAVAMDTLGLPEEPVGDLLGEMEFARTMLNPKERRRGTDEEIARDLHGALSKEPFRALSELERERLMQRLLSVVRHKLGREEQV